MTDHLRFGLVFPPSMPPESIRAAAISAETAGLDDFWVSEDCFTESAVASAVAALAATERVRVGIALLPVPLRSVAQAAMELATIDRLFPGRFMGCIGHGVQVLMEQAGVRADAPLTLLREYATALRRLDLASAGVTGISVQPCSDEADLDAFARFLGAEVKPLLAG